MYLDISPDNIFVLASDITKTISTHVILPDKRYQDVAGIPADVKKLLDVLSGAISNYGALLAPPLKKKMSAGKKAAVTAAVLAVFAGSSAIYLNSSLSPFSQPGEKTILDLTQIPLEKDDSIILTQANVPYPITDNILKMDVQATVSVRVNVKDFSTPAMSQKHL